MQITKTVQGSITLKRELNENRICVSLQLKKMIHVSNKTEERKYQF